MAQPRPERKRPGSIRQVAELAGVSIGTVSNVMNSPHLVAEATRLRVEEAIRATGFVRNAAARQLRGIPSTVVGCVLLDLSNTFFAEVARGIEDRLAEDGCVAVLCSTDVKQERERHFLRILQETRVRGVIINPVDPDGGDFTELPDRGTPVVLLDNRSDHRQLCAVTVDNVAGGMASCGHLLDLGHRRIALLCADADVRSVMDRAEGVRKAVLAGGLDPDRVLFEIPLDPPRNRGSADAAIEQAVTDPEPPTAFLCFNDTVAATLLAGLHRRGVAVPGDVSVIGYDDVTFAGALFPPLTTVRQPKYEIGRAAAELLLSESEPDHLHREVVFAPELVVRQSTGAPPEHPRAL